MGACQPKNYIWQDKGFLEEIFNGGNISFGKCVESPFKQPGDFGEVAQESCLPYTPLRQCPDFRQGKGRGQVEDTEV
jgi:hypothetical protein